MKIKTTQKKKSTKRSCPLNIYKNMAKIQQHKNSVNHCQNAIPITMPSSLKSLVWMSKPLQLWIAVFYADSVLDPAFIINYHIHLSYY